MLHKLVFFSVHPQRDVPIINIVFISNLLFNGYCVCLKVAGV